MDETKGTSDDKKACLDTSSESLEQTQKQMTDRFKLIEELIATEYIYVEDLKVLMEAFVTPIQKQEILSPGDFNSIFSNLNNILECNKKLYTDLRQSLGTRDLENAGTRLSSVFLKYAEFLKMYQLYCQNRPNSIATQERCLKTIKKYAASIEEILQSERVNQQPLDSFLVKPVQRICRYPMIFEAILKKTPPNHSDYKEIETTLAKLKKITDVVNDYARKKDSENKLFELDMKLTGFEGTLTSPGRELILDGLFTVTYNDESPETKHVLLTNDMLVLLKVKKKKLLFKHKFDIVVKLSVEYVTDELKIIVSYEGNSAIIKFETLATFEIWVKALTSIFEKLKEIRKSLRHNEVLKRKRSSSALPDMKSKKEPKSPVPSEEARKSKRKSAEVLEVKDISESPKKESRKLDFDVKKTEEPAAPRKSHNRQLMMKRSSSVSSLGSNSIKSRSDLMLTKKELSSDFSKPKSKEKKKIEKHSRKASHSTKQHRFLKTQGDEKSLVSDSVDESEDIRDSEGSLRNGDIVKRSESSHDTTVKQTESSQDNISLLEEITQLKKNELKHNQFKEQVLKTIDRLEAEIRSLRQIITETNV